MSRITTLKLLFLSIIFCTTCIWTAQLSAQNCAIEDLEAEIVDCENGEFFVLINFEFAAVSDSFEIVGNGNNYGMFSYLNLPILLGPFDDNETYEFIVVDLADPNCQEEVIVGPVNCGPPECDIRDLIVEIVDCENDEFFAEINFIYENTSDSFTIEGNGNNYGIYEYVNLPITLGPLVADQTNYSFLIKDVNFPDCAEDVNVGVVECDSMLECDISELIVEVVDCENGEFFAVISFDFENTSDSFELRGNGNNYGLYSYGDLPITLGPLPADLTQYEFVVIDQTMPDCAEDIGVGQVECDSINLCELFDLVVEVGACTSDSTYEVFIDFEFANSGGVGFDLFANGQFFEFFPYSDLPLMLSNFPLEPGQSNGVTICDNDNANCCISDDWRAPECDSTVACDIRELRVQIVDCVNGEFFAIINFLHRGASDSFEIAGNGNNYGQYAYDDLPITLGPLPADQTEYEFVVIDLGFPNCVEDIDIGQVDCDTTGGCNLAELEIISVNPNTDSTFVLTFNFEYDNTSDSFDVFSGRTYIGTYAYADLPVTIIDFPTRGLQDELLRVCDMENNDCCAVIEFIADGCEKCRITDLSLEVVECANDSVFFFLDFNIREGSSDGFEVIGNGNNYGNFNYHQLPVVFGLEYEEGDNVDIIVRDLSDENCLNYILIDEASCDSLCEFTEMNVEFQECTSDSTYNFILSLAHTGTGGLGFDLIANGEPFGFYLYSELPVLVEDFPSSGGVVDVITVCDNDNSLCCRLVEYEVPSCISSLTDTEILEGLIIKNNIGRWDIEISEPGSIAVFDMTGREVIQPTDVQDVLVVNNLASGVYLVSWSGWWGTVSKRAVFFGQ